VLSIISQFFSNWVKQPVDHVLSLISQYFSNLVKKPIEQIQTEFSNVVEDCFKYVSSCDQQYSESNSPVGVTTTEHFDFEIQLKKIQHELSTILTIFREDLHTSGEDNQLNGAAVNGNETPAEKEVKGSPGETDVAPLEILGEKEEKHSSGITVVFPLEMLAEKPVELVEKIVEKVKSLEMLEATIPCNSIMNGKPLDVEQPTDENEVESEVTEETQSSTLMDPAQPLSEDTLRNLELLGCMGFIDVPTNVVLLSIHQGSISEVIDELLQL